MDEYSIEIVSLAALPSETDGVVPGRVYADLHHRRIAARKHLEGDRYYDWKKGEGQADVRAILEQLRPCPGAPLTFIRVWCYGRLLARVMHTIEVRSRE